MRSGFARLHPLVDLTFFVLVLAFAMFLSHPAVQLAGLVCAALFALRCTGRGFGRRMAMLLPLMLLAAVVNPLVSHQGVTVLFRFPSGNACTLESVLYGISAAVRLGTAVLWFMGWNAVMTSDKFVYLFGRILPSLSLTLSMGLRFVPRLLRRTREVAQAQKLARVLLKIQHLAQHFELFKLVVRNDQIGVFSHVVSSFRFRISRPGRQSTRKPVVFSLYI